MLKMQNLLRGKSILFTGLAVLANATGIAITLPSDASALGCRTFTAQTAWYEGGRYATNTYTVPDSNLSGCTNIYVKDIQNLDPRYPNDHCAFFTVALLNAPGTDPTYMPEKFACSTGPNGSLRPIAYNVPNGKKYFVLYRVETTNPATGGFYRHSFKIVD